MIKNYILIEKTETGAIEIWRKAFKSIESLKKEFYSYLNETEGVSKYEESSLEEENFFNAYFTLNGTWHEVYSNEIEIEI